jgi:hypothetical protein
MKWLIAIAIPNAAAGIGMSALGFGITTWQHWAVGVPVALVSCIAYAFFRD